MLRLCRLLCAVQVLEGAYHELESQLLACIGMLTNLGVSVDDILPREEFQMPQEEESNTEDATTADTQQEVNTENGTTVTTTTNDTAENDTTITTQQEDNNVAADDEVGHHRLYFCCTWGAAVSYWLATHDSVARTQR